jgi:hypothetical protein
VLFTALSYNTANNRGSLRTISKVKVASERLNDMFLASETSSSATETISPSQEKVYQPRKTKYSKESTEFPKALKMHFKV